MCCCDKYKAVTGYARRKARAAAIDYALSLLRAWWRVARQSKNRTVTMLRTRANVHEYQLEDHMTKDEAVNEWFYEGAAGTFIGLYYAGLTRHHPACSRSEFSKLVLRIQSRTLLDDLADA